MSSMQTRSLCVCNGELFTSCSTSIAVVSRDDPFYMEEMQLDREVDMQQCPSAIHPAFVRTATATFSLFDG